MPAENIAPDIWFPNMGIWFNRVPQHLFTIGNFSIYLYAVMIVIGIIAAYFLAVWYAKKTGQRAEDYTDLLLLGVIMAFIGLRVYYLIFNWEQFAHLPLWRALFDLRGGGLAIYGGIIGAILAGVIMAVKKKIPFTTLADTCAPSLLLGQVIGRFGNFFNREAFGGYTDNIFAMRIRLDQARMVTEDLLETAAVHAQGVVYLQVHPTFLYEAGLNFILMILLILYRPYKRFAGEIILLYFLGYGIIRFFVEGLRTDQLIFFGTGLPASQIVAVVSVVAAIILLVLGYMGKLKPITQAQTKSTKKSRK